MAAEKCTFSISGVIFISKTTVNKVKFNLSLTK